VAYTRVPVGYNQPLAPGLYEAQLAVSGDISRATKADLQRILSQRFGQALEVVDWGRARGQYVLQFRVKNTSTTSSNPDIIQPAAFWIPVVITVAAIAGAIYYAYRFTVEIKSAFRLVSQPARDTAVTGVGVAGLGLGAVLVGVYLLSRR
jgi:hypothetical protein